jgi:Apc15p protein
VVDQLAPLAGPVQNGSPYSLRRTSHSAILRSPLARLRADEVYIERRKQNVQNYGSSWIKPPGIFKSLHQIREERREIEEHQEALRREQLAQELAEAEAGDDLLQGEDADGEVDEARDLDDDIPEAEATGIDADDSENDVEAVPRGILGQRMLDETYRETLVRGEDAIDRRFVVEGGSDTDEEDQFQMFREEDLVHELVQASEHDLDVAMDADLDDDVPEAEIGGYEHTDTEEELSTSDDDDINMRRFLQDRHLTTSMVRSDGTQNSLDLNSMDLQSDNGIGRSPPRPRSGNAVRPLRGRNS